MALDEKYYEAAHSALEARRAQNESLRLRKRSEVISKIPQYAELEAKLSANATSLISLIMERSENLKAKLSELKDESLETQQQMNLLLEGAGFGKHYLDPIYTCPACQDRGSVDGKWCGCFMKIVYAAASKALNSQSPMELKHFEDFSLALYPDAPEAQLGGESAKKIMTKNVSQCVEFAEKFDGTGNGIFMIGGTGLGKTHLSLAVANRVIERGHSAIYGSVPELLRMLDNEQFNRTSGDTMSLLMGCELLVLDDLGAEVSSERNITRLYEIINARINRNLPMIVSTNLTAPQIKERYQDRIWSRLFSMNVLMFCGTDNRIKLANK